MPQQVTTADFLQRLAVLEETVAKLQRSGRTVAEVPFYPTAFTSMAFNDSTAFSTTWETRISPRTSTFAVGLVYLGDSVASVNTGGEFQVLLGSTVVLSGSVAATFSYQFGSAVVDMTPYLQLPVVHVQIQVRRTSGATTGGRNGSGGSIGIAPTYAQLL